MRHGARHAPSSLIATGLSNSTMHYAVHCLSHCSLTLFIGTVHGHYSWGTVHIGFSNRVFSPVGPRIFGKNKSKP